MSSYGKYFDKAYDYYHGFSRNNTSAGKCSICAHMFIHNRQKGHSYVDTPPTVVHRTECGHYIKITNKKNDPERLEDSLCYGSALYHTDRLVDPIEHTLSQFTLITEAIDILILRKLDLFDKKPVIVYIKMNNGLMKAKKSLGNKVKHPHVWIMKKMPDYGKIFHTDQPDPDEDHYDFIKNQLVFADALMDLNPLMDIYLKFYVEISPFVVINRCEIDIYDPSSKNSI